MGGLEIMANMLAHEFCYLNHDVTVITLAGNQEEEPKTLFKIIRSPSIITYWNTSVVT
jgi:hypothetical protein